MNDIDREDRIDRYLRGEMNPEETKAMEKDMAKDKQLAKDVETTRTIIERMRALEEKKRLMAQWEEEYQASKKKEQEGPEQEREQDGPEPEQERPEPEQNGPVQEHDGPAIGKNRFRWTLTVITSLAACIVAGLFLWKSLPTTDPGEPVEKGGSALKYIGTLIDEGKYDEAISLIDTALADTIIDTTLPEEKQEEMRKEKAEEHDTLIQLRQRAVEGKAE